MKRFHLAALTATLLLTAACAPPPAEEEGWVGVGVTATQNIGVPTHVWGGIEIELPTQWEELENPDFEDEEDVGVFLAAPTNWENPTIAPLVVEVDASELEGGNIEEFIYEEVADLVGFARAEGLAQDNVIVPQHVQWPGLDIAAGMFFIASGADGSGPSAGTEGMVVIGARDTQVVTIVMYPETGTALHKSQTWDIARSLTFP